MDGIREICASGPGAVMERKQDEHPNLVDASHKLCSTGHDIPVALVIVLRCVFVSPCYTEHRVKGNNHDIHAQKDSTRSKFMSNAQSTCWDTTYWIYECSFEPGGMVCGISA